MTPIKEIIKKTICDRKVMMRIYGISLGAALILLVMALKGPEQKGVLLTDSDGSLTGIKRHSMSVNEQYDVTLTIRDAGEITARDLTLTVRAVESSPAGSAASDSGISREAEIDAEVDNMLTEIEYSDEEIIPLPSSLADGTPVSWAARRQEDRSGIMLIPVIYMILIILTFKSGLDSGRNEDVAVRKEIMKSLPRFCNQLFLMMNSGMILSDAFEEICSSYIRYGGKNLSLLEKDLSEICAANADHRTSTADLLSEYAARRNIKELVRIASILTENEKRGSDVIQSLERESIYLWDERKIVSRENGRMIDTRMSLPLGLLLILLIVITMAPALMNM